MKRLYKVLLADDESLDLEGMKAFIPWEELGLEVVEAVTSGFAAIKVLESKQIDILVTDVNMPNMSGIELARKALEKSKDTRVIFVSGYQDFHYVKQALTLNACDYVLKPMDDAELIGSLTKVRGELDRERERRQQEQAFRQMVPMVKNELLLRLFEGSCGPDELDLLRRRSMVWTPPAGRPVRSFWKSMIFQARSLRKARAAGGSSGNAWTCSRPHAHSGVSAKYAG
ncbi:response regulator [Paenibacillus sp. P25]|nr:response regulator [Paenibacillus sp. P25]